MELDLRTRIVHLTSGGTSLLVRVAVGGSPEVLHWGPALSLDAADADAVDVAALEPLGDNAPNERQVVAIQPVEAAGWMGRPGIVGHRPDGSAWAPDPRIVSVAVSDGTAAALGDQCVEMGTGSLAITSSDPVAGVDVVLTIQLTADGIVRMRSALTNTADSTYEVEELAIVMPLPFEASEVLDFTGKWGRERQPQRAEIDMGCRLREGRHGRTGFDAPMMMFAGVPGFGFRDGQVWGLHTAMSSNHRTWIEKVNTGAQVIGGSELLMPGEVVLATGRTYETPWIWLGQGLGLDDVAQRLHRHLRTRPGHPGPNRPVSLNVWEAVHLDHSLDKLVELADTAARVGIERYVLDDGWFHLRFEDNAGLGDWWVEDEKWPNGLHPIVDHVTGLGMQFGLWVEPEMVNPDSDTARRHPEWIMAAGQELPMAWRDQQVLNLAIPEAYEYVRDALMALLDEYDISYLKWDHNRDLIAAGDQTRQGRASVHAQTLATYRLMDELRAAHPGLEIESCASGGGRIDLEMALHAQRFWASDCIDPHERQQIVRWTEQLVPPEMVGTHVASAHSETTGRRHPLEFRGATALWGHMGVEWDICGLPEGQEQQLADWISLYKANRELLLTGDVVRQDMGEKTLWLHGVVSADRDAAMYELVTRGRAPLSPRGRFKLPGLDDDRKYRVSPLIVGEGPEGLIPPPWFGADSEGVVMTGRSLRLCGLSVPRMFPDNSLPIAVRAI